MQVKARWKVIEDRRMEEETRKEEERERIQEEDRERRKKKVEDWNKRHEKYCQDVLAGKVRNA